MRKTAQILTVAVLVCMLCVSSAFAAIPGFSVIIGDKAFDIGFLMEPNNGQEIQEAINEAVTTGGRLFFQLEGVADEITDIFTGQPATADELSNLPEITYKDAEGNVTRYSAGNGPPVSENTANATVQLGAMSFKNITVNSTNIEGGVKFMVLGSSLVREFGEVITIMSSESTVTVYILDVDGNTLASGDLDISAASESIDFALTTEVDFEVISID